MLDTQLTRIVVCRSRNSGLFALYVEEAKVQKYVCCILFTCLNVCVVCSLLAIFCCFIQSEMNLNSLGP